MNKAKEILVVLFLMTAFILPRGIGLGKFVTVDEPFWLHVGSNFYYALGQHEFQKTVYEYHPAVTTMWIVSGGMAMYFPEFRTLEQGYLKRGKFDLFLPEHGKDHLHLLIYSRALQIIVISILLLGIYFLLHILSSKRAAIFTVLLLSFSPFFFGHSRVLNHEAMLALFDITAILALIIYLFKRPHFLFLLTSGICAALAQLTKSTGFLLFPVIGILFLYQLFESKDVSFQFRITRLFKILSVWIILLIGAYFLFWPGMWVDPGKMLFEVYGNALTYFFQGSRVSAIGFDPQRFHLAQNLGSFPGWLAGITWRTTPLTWIGSVFGFLSLFIYDHEVPDRLYKLIFALLTVLGVLFILVFTLAPGLDSPHYAMNAYVCIDILAGLGFVRLLNWFNEKYPISKWTTPMLMLIMIALQAASLINQYPYYYTYYNPILEALQQGIQNPTLKYGGYGEGLDRAAAYLAQKPNSPKMTVMSFFGYGPFSFLFPGTTIAINNLSMNNLDEQTLEELQASSYVVIDYRDQKRLGLTSILDDVQPEKVISINGIEYIHIYETQALRERYFSTGP